MIVIFNPDAFRARYPIFANVSDTVLSGAFMDAGLYLSNTDTSPVQDYAQREALLWKLTAHIAYLEGAINANGAINPVGRLASASEGSVSVSYAGLTPGTGDWFNQTPWGAQFWQATINLRSMHYVPNPTQPYATNGPRDYIYNRSGYGLKRFF